MKGKVKLRFCSVNGEIRNVSDFAHLTPKNRPAAVCPECKNLLILRLGDVNAHHAAHKTEASYCSLTTGEGMLHLNTKHYIYEQLRQGSKLVIKQFCSKCATPGFNPFNSWLGSRPYLWLEDWDEVQMEKKIGSLRPDIVLYRGGQPVAAIEVFVTHRLDEEKRARLGELGLPWIEVKAEGEEIDEYFVNFADGYEDEFVPWRIGKPLIYHECSPQPDEWVCDHCRTAPERAAAMLKKRDEQEASRQAWEQSERLKKIADEQEKTRKRLRYTHDHDNHILFARAIMLLKPFGETELLELFVVERRSPEPPYTPEELYLKLGRTGGQILISEEPITENSRQAVNEFAKNLVRLKEKRNQEVLKLTAWLPLSEYEKQIKNFTFPKEWKRFQGWVWKTHPVER